MSCWKALNIPVIKTEPRDTSPQSFAMYRAPPELTPSPQPLSPSSAYNHHSPSPYSTATTVAATTPANQQLIPLNQQYNVNNTGPGGGNNVNPPAMDIGDFNAYNQQTQQYNGNTFGSAGAPPWETKYDPTHTNVNNNLNTNTFTMHNLLTPTSAAGGPGNGTSESGGSWNLIANHFHSHHMQQQQQQQLQRQYQQHPHQTPNNDAATTNNSNGVLVNMAATEKNNNNNVNNNNNSNEHGISNLLTFDSEQLVRINSEDQRMLRLDSEDLQISNLSIST